MIEIKNDVGRVLGWEAAEGEERHHDLITGKYEYAARLKQAWIGWKIQIQEDRSTRGSSTACNYSLISSIPPTGFFMVKGNLVCVYVVQH